MFQAFLIKYAEIGIKGKNRYLFEDALVRHMARVLKEVDGHFVVSREMGRIYVNAEGDFDYDGAVEALQRVFGIAGICPVVITEDEGYDKLAEAVTVEVRNKIYIYSEIIPGPGGMPVGTNGSAMLLLSGGIDSPVAGYMVAKRGVKIDAVYFHAPPYTSDRAKQKVVDLARLVARYSGPIRLHVVNFTEIQLAIYEKCPHDELTIIMRRYMMKIAEAFAEKDGALGLITGESIGQVASQTMHSLACTNEVCTMPVFRPLIGFDKQEIVDVSLKIGTYDTSVLPYEDCCTIFVAKHPVTKPNLKMIQHSEKKLADVIDGMLETAVSTAETIEI